MKLSSLAVATLALLAPVGAQAAVFNGVCAAAATATQAVCTSTNGTYGVATTIASTNDATLSMKITGWQASQTQNPNSNPASFDITSAFLGAYSGGFGVTGLQDQNGAANLHQIDNVNGYTDFVMLQFSTAVHLDGIGLNFYGINGVFDSDASFYNASGIMNTSGNAITAANWNSTINLANYDLIPSLWSTPTTTPDNATQVGASNRTNNATGFSQVWLVGASVLSADRDDGFKLSSLTVTRQTPPIPEPATWAMMIAGFGAIGASMRRRRAADLSQIA